MTVQPKVFIDRKGFDLKIKRLKQNVPEAGRQTVVALMDIAGHSLVDFSDGFTDTNRYINGWIDAANQVGVNIAKRQLKRPKRFHEIGAVLRKQERISEGIFKFWSARVKGMEQRPGHAKWKSYREAKKKLSKAVDLYDRAIENRERFDETKGTGVINFGPKSKNKILLSSLNRVIFKTYGGSGRIFQRGTQWFGEMRNAEPHAKLVEKKHRVVSKTKARLRLIGGRNASKKYLESLTAGVVGAGAGGAA